MSTHRNPTSGKGCERPSTYICSACGRKFEQLDRERANREAEALWGVKNASEDPKMSIVCRECFKDMMNWLQEKHNRHHNN